MMIENYRRSNETAQSRHEARVMLGALAVEMATTLAAGGRFWAQGEYEAASITGIVGLGVLAATGVWSDRRNNHNLEQR